MIMPDSLVGRLRRTFTAGLAVSLLASPLSAQIQVSFYKAGYPGAGLPNAPSATNPLSAASPICTTTVSSIGFDFTNAATRTALCGAAQQANIQYSFAARFIGSIIAPAAGAYTLNLNTDDGNVFTVVGVVSNSWSDQGGGPGNLVRTLAAGPNAFTLDYYSNSFGGSNATLSLPAGLTFGAPVSSVPEPGTWALVAGGLVTLAGVARRRRA
jgi:hypothetical protein